MKFRSRFRGPKLRIKLLLLFAVVLLVVPWLGYVQLVEMERLLVQGQESSQRQNASAVAFLLHNRADLFKDLPVQIEHYEHLFARPIDGSILVDGNPSDWGPDLERNLRTFGTDDGSFDLALGEKINMLFGFVRIRDPQPVYRNPGLVDVTKADHLLISFKNVEGESEQIVLTFSSPGEATSYRMLKGSTEVEEPITNVGGYLRETENGFDIEFEFPLSLMGTHRDFAISFVDVDDPETGEIRETVRTISNTDTENFNLVVLRSAQTVDLIERLGYVNTRILVVDTQHRHRGETEVSDSPSMGPSIELRPLRGFFRTVRPVLHRVFMGEQFKEPTIEEAEDLQREAIESALRGEPHAVRRISPTGAPSILAAHPVQSQNEILGAVVVEQDIEDILAFQQKAFGQILFVSLLAFAIVIVVALGYSIRLAYRIHRLRRAATRAIDEHGRLKTPSLDAEVQSGDEIGDLARSINNMLDRLHQHQEFLQRMPRTLRHEINNPLNAVSTSLENLKNTSNPDEQERYVQSARRGVMRIGNIVQNLSDAASLEDALKNEELEVIDIQELVRGYVANLHETRSGIEVVFRGAPGPAFARVSDFHIEQMLDKIVDNAIDFHRPDSPIKVQLDRGREFLQITVANRGPAFKGDWNDVFNSLVSHRTEQSTLHFGLGLFVVRVIAEFHGGNVRATNLADGSGVAICVEIPLLSTSASASVESRKTA